MKISPESCLFTIPDEIYREACVYTTEEAIASCQVVGYPAMIKASWGGGGKGIRKVCFMHGCIVISDLEWFAYGIYYSNFPCVSFILLSC